MNRDNINLLKEIQKALVSYPTPLTTDGKEGRVLAKENEDEIKDHLENLQMVGLLKDIEIINPPEETSKGNKTDRSWWDICFHKRSTNTKLPVNIKCSSGFDNAINVSGWLPLAWTFTNIPITLEDQRISVPKELKIKRGGDPRAFSQVVNKYQKGKFIISGRDYGFLVVDRKNPSDVIINTLLNLKKVCRNPANLPFQVKWKDNRDPSMGDPSIAASIIGDAITNASKMHVINEFKKFKYGA